MPKKKGNVVDTVAMVLSGVGAINWLPIGVTRLMGSPEFNLVTTIAELPVLNMIPGLENVIYVSAGLSGVWLMGRWVIKKLG